MLFISFFFHDFIYIYFYLQLRGTCLFANWAAHVYYGDPAYPLRVHLQAPLKVDPITPEMAEYSRNMSSVRISVECMFGDIVNSFRL